jgi:hypothetical protein
MSTVRALAPSSAKASFSSQGADVQRKILSYLDPESICKVSRVSKAWNALCEHPQVWTPHLQRDFPRCQRQIVEAAGKRKDITNYFTRLFYLTKQITEQFTTESFNSVFYELWLEAFQDQSQDKKPLYQKLKYPREAQLWECKAVLQKISDLVASGYDFRSSQYAGPDWIKQLDNLKEFITWIKPLDRILDGLKTRPHFAKLIFVITTMTMQNLSEMENCLNVLKTVSDDDAETFSLQNLEKLLEAQNKLIHLLPRGQLLIHIADILLNNIAKNIDQPTQLFKELRTNMGLVDFLEDYLDDTHLEEDDEFKAKLKKTLETIIDSILDELESAVKTVDSVPGIVFDEPYVMKPSKEFEELLLPNQNQKLATDTSNTNPQEQIKESEKMKRPDVPDAGAKGIILSQPKLKESTLVLEKPSSLSSSKSKGEKIASTNTNIKMVTQPADSKEAKKKESSTEKTKGFLQRILDCFLKCLKAIFCCFYSKKLKV